MRFCHVLYSHIKSYIIHFKWSLKIQSLFSTEQIILFSSTTIIIPKAIKQRGSPPSFTSDILFQASLTPWNLCRESLLSVSCPSGQSCGDDCQKGGHHHQYHRHRGGQRPATDRVCLLKQSTLMLQYGQWQMIQSWNRAH